MRFVVPMRCFSRNCHQQRVQLRRLRECFCGSQLRASAIRLEAPKIPQSNSAVTTTKQHPSNLICQVNWPFMRPCACIQLRARIRTCLPSIMQYESHLTHCPELLHQHLVVGHPVPLAVHLAWTELVELLACSPTPFSFF